jgi:hypothetical protein
LILDGKAKPEMKNLMNDIQQGIHSLYPAKFAVYQKFENG